MIKNTFAQLNHSNITFNYVTDKHLNGLYTDVRLLHYLAMTIKCTYQDILQNKSETIFLPRDVCVLYLSSSVTFRPKRHWRIAMIFFEPLNETFLFWAVHELP